MKRVWLMGLGAIALSCTLLNAPELVTINGPLTYLARIPLVGIAAKRAVVVRYAQKFAYHTQPNIDANRELVHELHGTLTPGRVARVALERLADAPWLAGRAQALRSLYREHVGASVRMASGVLSLGQAS